MADSLLSFGEQALHYFRRPHDSIPREPLRGPAAWRGAELARRDDWIVRLEPGQIDELERARAGARAEGLTLETLTREAFPLPALATAVADWRRELRDGRGFLLLRGLPVRDRGEQEASLVYWGLGLHLGRPGAQNPQGELLGHVTDYGEAARNPNVRRYRTAGDIAYHCDLADVVGLLCLQTPSRGGASRIASSVSVYNQLLTRRPDLVDRLYEPFLLDVRDEQKGGGPRHIPVPPCRHAEGRLRTFFHSDYFRSVTRHPDVPPFSDDEQTLLDLYDEIAQSPELRLDMQFEVGDVQLLSNHFVVHARTAYEDTPGEPRHLLRLWLSLHDD
ncbi:MAG: TauD/TfdA family dioxygenase [Myxococcota bacterium]